MKKPLNVHDLNQEQHWEIITALVLENETFIVCTRADDESENHVHIADADVEWIAPVVVL